MWRRGFPSLHAEPVKLRTTIDANDLVACQPDWRPEWRLEAPVILMASMRSSTGRVQMPRMQASWTTAVSAFSGMRLGSRKPGCRWMPLQQSSGTTPLAENLADADAFRTPDVITLPPKGHQ